MQALPVLIATKTPFIVAKRLANVGILQTYAGDLTEGDQSLRAALCALSIKSKSLIRRPITPLAIRYWNQWFSARGL